MGDSAVRVGIYVMVVVTGALWLCSEAFNWHVAFDMLTGVLFAVSCAGYGAQWQIDRQAEELAAIERMVKDVLN